MRTCPPRPRSSAWAVRKDADFYTLRGVVEKLLGYLGLGTVRADGGENYLQPGRRAQLMAGDAVVCTLGEVHPDVRERFDMPARAYIAELDLEQIAALRQPMGDVKPMPRYPAVTRDLSLVMAESTQVGPLMRDMADSSFYFLVNASMFDVYRSALLGADKKSVAFSFCSAPRSYADGGGNHQGHGEGPEGRRGEVQRRHPR